MSRTQDPNWPSSLFGNPFKKVLHKGSSYSSSEHVGLLKKFEKTLADRFTKLQPEPGINVLTFPYITKSLQLLSETHKDITAFLIDLELPMHSWEDKWIDAYLDNSLRVLDISLSFTSEINRLKQGQLSLQCCLHNLKDSSTLQPTKARAWLHSWTRHISSSNPKMDTCCSLIHRLVELLHLPEVKSSPKGNLLARALHGFRVQTLFVCSLFVSAFDGSAKKLIDLPMTEQYLWASAFTGLQSSVNGEVVRHSVSRGRNTLVKELEAVEAGVKKLSDVLDNGGDAKQPEALRKTAAELGAEVEELSSCLDRLEEEVDGIFRLLMGGRDALLCSLRLGEKKSRSYPDL